VLVQDFFHTVELAQGKAIVLSQAGRASWTVQVEDRCMFWANDVNMGWPVIVRVDDYTKIANSQNGRHGTRIAYS
jgi:hypothetical protein